MQPAKARKLMADFQKNNFNAKKTLLQNGYAEVTADKSAGVVMARATKAIAREIAETPTSELVGVKRARTAMEVLGLDESEVTKALRTIALNQRDYPSALKVLSVLANEIGVNLTSEETKTQPLLNITVESGNSEKEPDNITGHLSSTVVEKTADDSGEDLTMKVDECQEVLGSGEGDIGEEEGER